MKRKRVFLTLALAPGLLVGAGAKIIGSKSVDQPAFAESTEALGNPTKKSSKIAHKTDTTSTEKKSATRRRHRRRRSNTRKTSGERIRKTATSAS